MRTIYLVKQFEASIRVALDEVLKPLEFTASLYTVLSMVGARPGRYSSADIARRLLITPQSANETIKALELRGLISRETDSQDPKILRISLSAEGRSSLRQLDRRVTEVEKKLLSVLSAQEQAKMHEALLRLLNLKEG